MPKPLLFIGAAFCFIFLIRSGLSGEVNKKGDPCAIKVQGTTVILSAYLEPYQPGSVQLTCNKGTNNETRAIVSYETDPLYSKQGMTKKVTIKSSVSSNKSIVTRVEGLLDTSRCNPNKDSVITTRGTRLEFDGTTIEGDKCFGEVGD